LTTRASQAKQDLKDELAANSSHCSLALDGWTSRLNNSYMGTILVAHKFHFWGPLILFCALQSLGWWLAITVYWIDDKFRLHEALLSFTEIHGRHTGERHESDDSFEDGDIDVSDNEVLYDKDGNVITEEDIGEGLKEIV